MVGSLSYSTYYTIRVALKRFNWGMNDMLLIETITKSSIVVAIDICTVIVATIMVFTQVTISFLEELTEQLEQY